MKDNAAHELLSCGSAPSASSATLGSLRQHSSELGIVLALIDMVNSHVSIFCQDLKDGQEQ
ncbi:hypothetical protein GB937_000230 [Aspergillus fischeri]|nr:hypothetical protein GB937_000230 [Aspergillus fischeri]